MRLKFGLFTWVVIGVVLALIVAAVLTANLSRPQVVTPDSIVAADSPAAPVVAAVLAVQNGDAAAARAQFSQRALDEVNKQGWDPIANATSNGYNNAESQRVRILKVSQAQVDANGMEYAYVTLAQDNFSNGGLFGRSTYTYERTIRVVKVEGTWKVDDVSLF